MPREWSPYDEARQQGALWTPRHAGADLRFWMQADRPDTLTFESGVVSEWRDIAGSGRNWTQSTATRRPSYDPNGFSAGVPGLVFDGTNDRTLRMDVTAISQPFILVIVARLTVNASGPHFFDGIRDTGGVHRILMGQTTNFVTFAGTGVLNGPPRDLLANVHVGIFDGASSAYRINDAQVATGNAGSHTWVNQYLMGGATGAIGVPAEAAGAVFGAALIAGNNVRMAERLAGYFAWAANMPHRLVASSRFRNAPPLI